MTYFFKKFYRFEDSKLTEIYLKSFVKISTPKNRKSNQTQKPQTICYQSLSHIHLRSNPKINLPCYLFHATEFFRFTKIIAPWLKNQSLYIIWEVETKNQRNLDPIYGWCHSMVSSLRLDTVRRQKEVKKKKKWGKNIQVLT